VAYEKKNHSICEKIEDIEYEAVGYLDKLSSKQICYGEYLYKARFEVSDEERNFVCSKILNQKYKIDLNNDLRTMNAKTCST
jgi:hypothetical protein